MKTLYNTVLDLNHTHKNIAKQIKQLTKKDSTLLDIGGGSGLLEYYLKDHFKKITILEPSKKISKNHNFKTINKKIQTYNTNHKFDTVVCFDSLHHFSNGYNNKFEQVMKGIEKMMNLTSKDTIIIEPNPKTLRGIWIKFVENYILRIGSHFLNEEQYKQILKYHNYEIHHYKYFLIIRVLKVPKSHHTS